MTNSRRIDRRANGRVPQTNVAKITDLNEALADLDPASWHDGSATSRTSIVLPAALLEDLRDVAGNDTARDAFQAVIPAAGNLGLTDSVSGIVRAATAAVLADVREELLARAYAAAAPDATATRAAGDHGDDHAPRESDDLLTDESLAHA